MPRRRQLRAYDLKQLAAAPPGETLVGVDEAGRGALAGPVVAAAVHITREFLESPWTRKNAPRINDSKQLTPAQRETLHAELTAQARAGHLRIAHAAATVDEIEHHNILGATKLAMARALRQLLPEAAAPAHPAASAQPELFPDPTPNAPPPQEGRAVSPKPPPQPAPPTDRPLPGLPLPATLPPAAPAPCRILIDGLPLKNFPYPHTALVDGDARSLAIAMASIIAKVTRDHLMRALDAAHPAHGFARHKGYGTQAHRVALLLHGPTPLHRKIFLRKLLDNRPDPAQLDLFEPPK